MKTKFLIAILVLLLQGCSSIDSRLSEHREKYYPGAKSDVETISYLATEWYFGIIIAIPVVIDLPFSTLLDTVALPWDCFKK